MRQALAGLLWGKQYYEYDVHRWLREHGVNPWDAAAPTRPVRNVPWFHMVAGDIISMPDKWEYPWFAAWDLAFHCAPLSLVDVDFAKEQVELLLRTRYLHPNGQIPAYEWNFCDVNPPVTAWAALCGLRARGRDPRRGRPRVPRARLRAAADELHLVGQPQGPRRPQPLPGRLPRPRQHRHLRPLGAAARAAARSSRPTAPPGWPCTASGCCRSRSSSPGDDPAYADIALKFISHFEWIAIALEPARRRHAAVGRGGRLLLRRHADARRDARSRSRCARSSACCRCARRRCSTPRSLDGNPEFMERVDDVRRRTSRDTVPALAHLPGPEPRGPRGCSSLVDEDRLRRILDDDARRGASSSARTGSARSRAATSTHPCVFDWGGQELRGPLPAGRVRHRHVRRQLELARPGLVPDEPRDPARRCSSCTATTATGFKVECPTGSGNEMNLLEVRDGDQPAPHGDVHRRRARPPAGLRRHRDASRPTRTGTT